MQQINLADGLVWFDNTLLSEADIGSVFEPEYWSKLNKVIGSAKGRGTTWFVQGEQVPMALRHYRRGGLFGKLVKDQYLFIGWERTRCYEEFMLLKHLRQCGVNVPRPLGAKANKVGTLFYRADILIELVSGARDLVALLKNSKVEHNVWYAIGEEIAKMHRAGVCHTDLNAHNILLDGDNQVWLIDFDKCEKREGKNWQQGNLNRLLRSFQKEKNKAGITFNEESHWRWLTEGYSTIQLTQ
ncbi:3-deoxy-D-manno-octulosonic acid kinase [Enterovibrio norvegicus]|uniref:3-deoxy-D-manno-octulosonic acid kinase n=1 Tax=Enterovibrio norvegicus TaxID=188144 RepID=UPI000C842FA5|nr:3-deoxy-D-manno-octulosonic acid kinase [Enterovibrio norvegicus]PML79737.1 3-deoxy-D-manno-octulosonic acid kinase [Enterovibrio norvegicus]